MNIQEEQKRFRVAAGSLCHDYPVAPESFPSTEVPLGQVLITEEVRELMTAIDACHEYKDDPELYWQLLAEVCAEAVDVLYVVCDLMNTLGLPGMAMFREIHRANMDKVIDGKVRRREDGKILKPAGWKAANKLGVLLEARDYKV